MKTIAIIAILVLAVSCKWADKTPFCLVPKLFPVTLKTSSAQVSVPLYMGTWYEIVRTPAPFQSECICSQAVYIYLKDTNRVSVTNSCVKKNGGKDSVNGYAYSKNDSNTKLKVYFSKFLRWCLLDS